MKTLLTLGACALLSVSAMAQNISTNFSIGSLTNVAASTTTNAPSTAVVQTKNYQEVFVRVAYKLSAVDANTTAGTFKFARAKYGTNDFDTTVNQQMLLSVTNNGLGWAYGSTNVYVGSSPFLYLVSAQNGSTNTMTNLVISAEFKSRRNGL